MNAETETARCTGHCCRAFILGDNLTPVKLGQMVRERKLDKLTHRWVTQALVYLGHHDHNPNSGRPTDSGNKGHWYACRRLTDAGNCGDYVNRPWTCVDYPHGRQCDYTGCTRQTAGQTKLLSPEDDPCD